MPHKITSSRICCRMTVVLRDAFSKTHKFLCFQSHHDTSIIKKLRLFFWTFSTWLTAALHHSCMTESPIPVGLFLHPGHTILSTLHQMSLANTQDSKICWVVSSSWSHIIHFSGWSSPPRSNRSVVHILLKEANQIKNLHHGGAQLFQILVQRQLNQPRSICKLILLYNFQR